MMECSLELYVTVQLLYAAFLGAAIGGRGRREGPLSMAVCLGACCLGILTIYAPASALRLLFAQVVLGVGFFAGLASLLEQKREDGLRSAAFLWVTFSVGLAVAYSMVVPTAVTALVLRHLRRHRARGSGIC